MLKLVRCKIQAMSFNDVAMHDDEYYKVNMNKDRFIY